MSSCALTDVAIELLNEMDEELALQEDAGGNHADGDVGHGVGSEAEAVLAAEIVAAAAVGLADAKGPAESSDVAVTRARAGPNDLIIYPSGMVCEFGIRQIGSIPRGKPKNSLVVSCTAHSKCTFVVPLWCAHTDDEFKVWFTSVPANEPGDTKEQKDAKKRDHLDLVARWRAPASVSAPLGTAGNARISASGAASSSGD